MPHARNGADDSPGILAAAASCLANSTIIFSEGITYNLLTPLSFTGLQNVRFEIEGNVSLSSNVTEVQTVVNNTKIYPGHWITVKGNDVVFRASERKDGGWFLGE
jgi:galacturan 1,4-alpha-galacturonidase